MDESARRRTKRGENLVKSVMVANGVQKPSRRAVLLTTLASERFIGALTQDAVVFKSPNESLRAHHLIHALAGLNRYSFVKNALDKFQAELDDAHQLAFKERTFGLNKAPVKGLYTRVQKQPQQDSDERNFNLGFVSEPTTNQNKEEDSKKQHAKEKDNFNNTEPDDNFK